MCAQRQYRCITCQQPVQELYRIADADYIKLIQCPDCGLPADRYVECEASVVVLELLLLRAPAFAHATYNSHYAASPGLVLKVLVCAVLSDGYLRWAVEGAALHREFLQGDVTLDVEEEVRFYTMCGLAALDLLMYITFIFIYGKWTQNLSPWVALRGAVLGRSVAVLHTLATVWEVAHAPAYRACAAVYLMMVTVQAVRATLQCGVREAVLLTLTAAATAAVATAAITNYVL